MPLATTEPISEQDSIGLLRSVAKKSDEHEFYSAVPEGYLPGKTKYVVVIGSVISGLGKGIFSASLGKLLQDAGLSVAPTKFDGYLNVDAGTLNPYRHGEVFVLDDGTECDMDLGTYERFLGVNISRDHYLTAGKIFSLVLDKERDGRYLGRDVQFIPHVTGEIKLFMRNLATKTGADIVLIEVGGTVGDIESSYFIEAMRELAYEEGKHNVIFINVTYILEPATLGEHKTKTAQLGLKSLMSLGVQPDIVVCRSETPISNRVREKVSVHSNLPVSRIVGLHDVPTIYSVPLLLKSSRIDEVVMDLLGLKGNLEVQAQKLREWSSLVEKLSNPGHEVTIGIAGKYTGLRDSYASILNALEHAGIHLQTKINIRWIETTEVENNPESLARQLSGVNGVIVPGGFGSRGVEGKIACVNYCRTHNIPYLGLCYGLQMAVIEFARNVCGLTGANTTEIDPSTPYPVIDILPEQKKIEGLGGNMRLGGRDVEIKPGTKAAALYGATKTRERFRHRYEVNPEFLKTLEKHGLVFSGKAAGQPIMQILEYPKNKFFMGTQFHPEYTSRPLRPNPIYLGFVKSLIE